MFCTSARASISISASVPSFLKLLIAHRMMRQLFFVYPPFGLIRSMLGEKFLSLYPTRSAGAAKGILVSSQQLVQRCLIQASSNSKASFLTLARRLAPILFPAAMRVYFYLGISRCRIFLHHWSARTCFRILGNAIQMVEKQSSAYVSFCRVSFRSRYSSMIRRTTSEVLIPRRLRSWSMNAFCGFVKTIDRWMVFIRTSVMLVHAPVKGAV